MGRRLTTRPECPRAGLHVGAGVNDPGGAGAPLDTGWDSSAVGGKAMGGPGRAGLGMVLACALASVGCGHFDKPVPVYPDMPSERQKTLLPEYVIESPDLLQIDLLYAVPLPPYRIQPLDVLMLNVPQAPEAEPIAGLYTVEPDGTVVLGG